MFCVTKWALAHFFLVIVRIDFLRSGTRDFCKYSVKRGRARFKNRLYAWSLTDDGIFVNCEVMDTESKAAPNPIEAMVEGLLKSEGLELVDLEFRKEARGWVLRIFMDKPGGVTLDDCSEISREIGDQIDVNELIPHSYTLEVSSPGLDRPLKKEKDFLGSIGKLIQLSTSVSWEGQTFFKGILLDFQASGSLRLAETKKTWEIPVELISKARLVFEG
jgi:ribosome maturation factor RimP